MRRERALEVARAALVPVAIGGSVLLLRDNSLLGDLGLVAAGGALAMLVAPGTSVWGLCAAALGVACLSLIGPMSFAAGSALFFGAVFAPRALHARSPLGGAAIFGAAAAGGALAATLTQMYGTHAWPLYSVAAFVGAMVIAIALVPTIDDPYARAFRANASRNHGATKYQMLRAAALRRRHDAMVQGLSRLARKRVKSAWYELLHAARLRDETRRVRSSTVDQRIQAYLSALQKATRAALAADHLTTELDDSVFVELCLEQETLSASASALEELRPRVSH